MQNITVRLSLEDATLLETTLAEYDAAVDRGELSEEEALDNANALASGMLRIDFSERVEPICRNCEYWDCGGAALIQVATSGDCGNSNSPRFNPEATFSCKQFYPDTSRWPRSNGHDSIAKDGR